LFLKEIPRVLYRLAANDAGLCTGTWNLGKTKLVLDRQAPAGNAARRRSIVIDRGATNAKRVSQVKAHSIHLGLPFSGPKHIQLATSEVAKMGKLVRLELCNFKSYRGHHVMLFGDSYFTSIIGPNGSGKSNS